MKIVGLVKIWVKRGEKECSFGKNHMQHCTMQVITRVMVPFSRIFFYPSDPFHALFKGDFCTLIKVTNFGEESTIWRASKEIFREFEVI